MTISAFAGFSDDGSMTAIGEDPLPPTPQGQTSPPITGGNAEPVDLLASYGLLGLRAVGGYLVGAALAPSLSSKRTYGLIGAACGGTFGTIALGIFAAIALGKRRGE